MITSQTVQVAVVATGTAVTLTILPSVGGTTDPAAGSYPYNVTDPVATVKITAIPDSGYALDHWLVDGVQILYPNTPGYEEVCQDNWNRPSMYADRSIQPVFKKLGAIPDGLKVLGAAIGLSAIGYIIYRLTRKHR